MPGPAGDRPRFGAVDALVLTALFGLLWSSLPCDNTENFFQTLIAWGRYARLMDFITSTGRVFVPGDEEGAEGLQAGRRVCRPARSCTHMAGLNPGFKTLCASELQTP